MIKEEVLDILFNSIKRSNVTMKLGDATVITAGRKDGIGFDRRILLKRLWQLSTNGDVHKSLSKIDRNLVEIFF